MLVKNGTRFKLKEALGMQGFIGSDGGNLGKSLAMIACNIDAYRHMMKTRRLHWAPGNGELFGSLSLSARRLKDSFRMRMEKIRSPTSTSPKYVLSFPHMLSRLPVVRAGSADSAGRGDLAISSVRTKSHGMHELVSDKPDINEKVNNAIDSKSSHPKIVCSEVTNGRRKVYLEPEAKSNQFVTEEDEESHVQKAKLFMAGYLLPQGYPESVAPQYSGYMTWRGVQYCFGGAISVFTTRLLCYSRALILT